MKAGNFLMALVAGLAGAFGSRIEVGGKSLAQHLSDGMLGRGRSRHAFSYHASRYHHRSGSRTLSAAAAKREARRNRNIRARAPK